MFPQHTRSKKNSLLWRVPGKENLSSPWAPPVFGREQNKSCRQRRWKVPEILPQIRKDIHFVKEKAYSVISLPSVKRKTKPQIKNQTKTNQSKKELWSQNRNQVSGCVTAENSKLYVKFTQCGVKPCINSYPFKEDQKALPDKDS